MLNITLGRWLDSVHGDDYFFLNVSRGKEQIYYGYEDKVPEELKNMVIDTVYVDIASTAFGIKVI